MRSKNIRKYSEISVHDSGISDTGGSLSELQEMAVLPARPARGRDAHCLRPCGLIPALFPIFRHCFQTEYSDACLRAFAGAAAGEIRLDHGGNDRPAMAWRSSSNNRRVTPELLPSPTRRPMVLHMDCLVHPRFKTPELSLSHTLPHCDK